MAKIKLGARPKNFKRVVKVQMLDGTEGSIEVVYVYRTRTDFGVFIDEILAAAKVTPKDGEEVPEFSMADLMEKTAGSNADYIMQVLEGWNLDVEFSKENVQQMADELPGVATAIMEAYRVACTEGRLGN